MMIDLELRLSQAREDLRRVVDASADPGPSIQSGAMPPRRRSLTMVSACAALAFTISGLVALALRTAERNAAQSPIEVDAGEQLASDALELGRDAGWSIRVISTSSATDSDGRGRNVEARFDDGSSGLLLIGIRDNDPQPSEVAAASSEGPVFANGDVSVFLRAQSSSVLAVELYSGETTVYVRWESPAHPSVEDAVWFAVGMQSLWVEHTSLSYANVSGESPVTVPGMDVGEGP